MAAETVTPYRPRLLDAYLDELLAQLPGILVIGPRAAGKTTMLSRRAASTVELDVGAQAAGFRSDPVGALRGLPEPVLLDEWQRVPEVLVAVKRAIDEQPTPNRFYATGSVHAEIEKSAWPATGRLVRVTVHPMTVRELSGRLDGPTVFDRLVAGDRFDAPPEPPDLRGYVELALRSGFPTPALELDGAARTAWLESYVEDLLGHDLEQLEVGTGRRHDRIRLRDYLAAYALNSAGVPEHKTIYEAAEVNKVSAIAYDRLLSDLLVAEQVPAWSSNRLRRLVRRPKRYLIDAALLAAVLRVDAQGVLDDGDLLGRLLDTFVAAQLRPELDISRSRPRLHHLRTQGGRHEVDLLAELGGGRVIGFEIKATAAPSRTEARHLIWLREQLGERFLRGVVFHTGPASFDLDERISAVPIAALWSGRGA
jgi:predicted AAA+ superfamily ATPase